MRISNHVSIEPKPGLGVVICRHHQYCLVPSSVREHFSTKHADHTKDHERQELQAYVNSQLEHLHEDITQIQPPSQPYPIVKTLRVYETSLKCNQCGYITTEKSAMENMKTHVRTHGIFAPEGGSRAWKNTWWKSNWTTITSQQLFERCGTSTQATKHFEVYQPSALDATESSRAPEHPLEFPIDPILLAADAAPSTLDGRASAVHKMIQALQQQLAAAQSQAEEEERASSALLPLAPVRQTNPYLEHTKFQQCVGGLKWSEIREYIVPVSNAGLQYLKKTVQSMTLVYQQVTACTPRWARIQVMQEHLQHVPTSPLIPYLAFNNKHSNTIVYVFTFFYQVLSQRLPCPRTLSVSKRQLAAWTAIQEHMDSLDDDYPPVDSRHGRRALTELEGKCHEFWMSLIEQTSVNSDFELALVTPLAFIAVDVQEDQFREAYNFATDCSAIKKYARMAGCCQFYGLYDQDDTLGQAGKEDLPVFHEPETTQAEAANLIQQQDDMKREYMEDEARARAKNTDFKAWVHHYLTSEFSTSIGWVISTTHYIAKFRYGETVDAFVRWNGPNVTVRHVTTSFEQYRSMVWALYDEAKAVLLDLTFASHDTSLPLIPWDDLSCNPSNNQPGYTPYSAKNAVLANQVGFVSQQMMESMRGPRASKLAITNLNDFDQVQRYCVRVQAFLDVLFLLVHFTSGQPGRLTEILSIQSQNTVSHGSRNLFMFHGLVAVVPRYHKGYHRDKSLKVVYRFLPRQIGSLLVWYLWLVKPFCVTVTVHQEENNKTPAWYQARSAFLWSNRTGEQYNSSERFASRMKEATRRHLGQEVGPSLLRHLLITFGRNHGQAKQSKLIALSPEEVSETLENMEGEATERQSGHQPNTAVAIYAQEMALRFRSANGDAQAFFSVSAKWHGQLAFDAPKPCQDGVQDPQVRRLAKRMEINLKQVLRANFARTAHFRGQQRAVLESIMAGEPAVSYVASTGSGKSLSFFLPALCDGYGQTIVITPLVALRSDQVRRSHALCVPTSVYGSSDFDSTAQMIFAMPEHLSNKKFIALVNRLRDTGSLDRIVVDEYHYILLPDHAYRPALLTLRDVAIHGVGLTLLSATIPKRRETEAFQLLGVEHSVQSFREPTGRPNIAYEVEVLQQKEAITVQDMATYVEGLDPADHKVLVYVATKAHAEQLSQQLGCACYHGGLDEGERDRIQLAFSTQSHGILVATTAFNAGVHIPDIDMVARFGAPDHPITFSQESGRAGRDGRPCIARIVLGQGIPSFFDQLHGLDRKVMEEFLERGKHGTKCMRVTLDEYFDGNQGRTCCWQHEARCGPCRRFIRKDAACLTQRHPSPRPPATPIRHPAPSTNPATVDSPDHLPDVEMLSSPPALRFRSPSSMLALATKTDPLSDCGLSSTPKVPVTPLHALDLESLSSSSTRYLSAPQPASSSSPTIHRSHRTGVHKRSQSMLEDTPSASDSLVVASAKKARVDRILGTNQRNILARNIAGARFEQEELRQTGEWWVENCVQCLTDGVEFDHPRASCPKYLGDLVHDYRRTRIKGKFPRGTCFFCALPLHMCTKWIHPETRVLLSQPMRSVPCTYERAFLDTWACLWEYAPKIKAHWLSRITSETQGQLDGNNLEDFTAYFQQGVRVGANKPVSRIVVDVNWITHTYFLGEGVEAASPDYKDGV